MHTANHCAGLFWRAALRCAALQRRSATILLHSTVQYSITLHCGPLVSRSALQPDATSRRTEVASSRHHNTQPHDAERSVLRHCGTYNDRGDAKRSVDFAAMRHSPALHGTAGRSLISATLCRTSQTSQYSTVQSCAYSTVLYSYVRLRVVPSAPRQALTTLHCVYSTELVHGAAFCGTLQCTALPSEKYSPISKSATQSFVFDIPSFNQSSVTEYSRPSGPARSATCALHIIVHYSKSTSRTRHQHMI